MHARSPPGITGLHESYRYYSLQADVEVLLLVGFEFLQRKSCFTNKFIVAKLVFITHRDPEQDRKERL